MLFDEHVETTVSRTDIHMPGETVTVGDLTSNGKTYYAKWVKGTSLEGPTPVATFNDGANNMPMEVKIAINPVQEGSGDPSPDNVRPISGWAEAKILNSGKNLLPLNYVSKIKELNTAGVWNGDVYTHRGITFTLKRNSQNEVIGVNVNGTNTSTTAAALLNIPIDLKPGNYVITGVPSAIDNNQAYYGTNVTGTNRYIKSSAVAIAISEEKHDSLLWIGVNESKNIPNIDFYPMVRSASEDSSFELPYAINHTITFPQAAGTVYGGELTIYEGGTGKLSVTHTMIDLGDLDWGEVGSVSGAFFTDDVTDWKKEYYNAADEHWHATIISDSYESADGTSITLQNGQISMYELNPSNRIVIKDASAAGKTGSEFKTYVTGKKAVYPLATPIDYYLSTAEVNAVLVSLKGTNNVWANTGDILYVKYRSE